MLLDLIVLAPFLCPVKARGCKGLFILDQRDLGNKLDTDLTRNFELITGLVAGCQIEEVVLCADLAKDTEFQRHDGQVKANACKRLHRNAHYRINQQCSCFRLVRKGYLQICVTLDFKTDICRNRTDHRVNVPLILRFKIGTNTSAYEVNAPLFAKDTDIGFENDGTVEVDVYRAAASAVIVIVVIVIIVVIAHSFAQFIKILLEALHIIIKVIGVEVDRGIRVRLHIALVIADRYYNTECTRILCRQDHHIHRRIACKSGQLLHEHKALFEHVIDINIAENFTHVEL